MDILSFSLGIAFVAVIVIAIVAVKAFFKVSNLETQFHHFQRDHHETIDVIYRDVEGRTKEVHDRIGSVENTINSKMDSRFDKLQSKQVK